MLAPAALIAVVAVVVAAAGVLLYWQLVIAEGAYLGRRAVTLLYDAFAGRYDRVKQFNPAADAETLGAPIAEACRDALAPVVLDIATGTGRVPLALFSQPSFAGRVIGLDASAKMLDVARAKLAAYAERVTWLQHEAETLPFDDATMDAVACLEALEFFARPAAALREAQRVLKPGGLLLISNRVGPDAWKFPGRARPTADLIRHLETMGFTRMRRQDWLVDYDLVSAIKC